jgi:hypothetical protein
MAKILFITKDRDHPRKIAIETAISTGDVSAISRNTTVPIKYRLAFEKTLVKIIVMIIIGAMNTGVITWMHQVQTDKIVDPGFHGLTTYHPKISLVARARCIFTSILRGEDNKVTSRMIVGYFKRCERQPRTYKGLNVLYDFFSSLSNCQ